MRISDWISDVCSSDLRVDNLSGMATGLAGRYATALFGLAREGKQIDTVSASLAKVRAALAESEDFRALTASPLIGRGAATSAVLGAAEAMGLDGLTRNFLAPKSVVWGKGESVR